VLPPIRHGQACIEPTVEKSIITRGKLGVLVQWKGPTAAETSWMALDEFRKLYPSFQLTDELIVQEGRDVMVGITYKWRGKQSAATAEEQNDAKAGTQAKMGCNSLLAAGAE
jgi:hypothetical protein